MLFVIVPVVFILGANAITPNTPITFFLTGPNGLIPHAFTVLEVHDATMAPIAVGSLAALVGLFTVLDSYGGDRRAALAGLRPASLLTARLGVLLFAALGATAISLATTALVFNAERWPTYAAANLLIAVT